MGAGKALPARRVPALAQAAAAPHASIIRRVRQRAPARACTIQIWCRRLPSASTTPSLTPHACVGTCTQPQPPCNIIRFGERGPLGAMAHHGWHYLTSPAGPGARLERKESSAVAAFLPATPLTMCGWDSARDRRASSTGAAPPCVPALPTLPLPEAPNERPLPMPPEPHVPPAAVPYCPSPSSSHTSMILTATVPPYHWPRYVLRGRKSGRHGAWQAQPAQLSCTARAQQAAAIQVRSSTLPGAPRLLWCCHVHCITSPWPTERAPPQAPQATPRTCRWRPPPAAGPAARP